ncbi:DUF2637 domain-containing protein [Actinokineospora inagensis]|uniref:DUF2637 domain-containing protein n=1 Tax=Actinokineospora inagensis TaxID=103730 RepID=UPI00040D189E|nr:DUF2637 domain-containing protein [Actinokineospora inagensis]
MSPQIDIEPEHAEALGGLTSIADKIRYACAQVDPPTTHAVQQWLAAYGIHGITRAYATGIISTWRGENRIGDTGDLVAMSPELLAELDALRSHTTATEQAATEQAATRQSADHPADDTPTAVDLTPVTAEVTAVLPPTPSPLPDSDTVDTDRDSTTATVTATVDTAEPATDLTVDPIEPTAPNTSTAVATAVEVETAEQPAVGNAVVVAEQPQTQPIDAYVTARANPLLEPPAPLTARVPTVLSWSANMAWIVVLVAAMGISWWSLFEYARGFSIPTPLAAVVSLVFDASALIVAGLAHRYALSPYSGAGPRFALLALLAGSVYLNWEHAAGKGYGIEASIMFAAPAAVGILLFELHIGWHSRSERRARGRVARSLPVIGAWGWFLHPLQSITTLWRVTHARGVSVREAELSSIEQTRSA